jgi:uncharacterized protein YdaU (DUF1376 family)
MSIAPNWFPFHIGDYLRDAEELSMLQHGAYLGLMCWYYSIGRPLPAQPQRIYNRLRANSVEERAAADFILTEFFVLTGPCWTHKRIDAELAKFQREQEARERGGEHNRIRIEQEKARRINETSVAPPIAPPTGAHIGNQNQNQNQNQKEKERAEATAKPKTDARRGTRLRLDWLPSDDLTAWAKQQRPDLDPGKTLETFRNYWLAKPGKGGTKLDWDATFKNWVLNEREGKGAKPINWDKVFGE